MGVMDGVSNPWISNFAVWPTDDIVFLYRFIMKAYLRYTLCNGEKEKSRKQFAQFSPFGIVFGLEYYVEIGLSLLLVIKWNKALLKSSKAKNIRIMLVNFMGTALTGVSVSGDFEFADGVLVNLYLLCILNVERRYLPFIWIKFEFRIFIGIFLNILTSIKFQLIRTKLKSRRILILFFSWLLIGLQHYILPMNGFVYC